MERDLHFGGERYTGFLLQGIFAGSVELTTVFLKHTFLRIASLKVLDPRVSLVDRVHQRFIRDWVEPDAVVWDVGSNLGLFALPAALKAARGRVYAFEPDVDLAGNLLRSLRLNQNKDLNVSVLCVAVSNVDGTGAFQISKYSRAMNKLEAVGKWHESQVAAEELRSVATMRIDTLSKTLAPRR